MMFSWNMNDFTLWLFSMYLFIMSLLGYEIGGIAGG
jgi:hypothetical protein